MNPRDPEQREKLLVGLMADYDEALAVDAPTDRIDETAAELVPQLAAKWESAKQCLELMDRVRRSGNLAAVVRDPPSGPPSAAAAPPRRLGRFIIERELGRGGLGIVYLAHDPKLGRKVALKIPRFEALLDDDLRGRFLREAEAAARLNHPHLVALHEVGEDGTTCYLASEYCPGPTLAQWLSARSSPVPPREAAEIMFSLSEAVEHAHGRGVLHRDIKPSNVLLSATNHAAEQNNRWSPKLTDFGMAKLLEQGGGDRTRSGAILGTLAYMSPEQAEGKTDQLDCRTDVYALGAILYEQLTGVAPYVGQTDVDTLRQMLINEPVAPRKLRPDVPRDLEAITLKCLAKNPATRYATAHELAADLQRFLEGQPTDARPLGSAARAVKWARRRPAIAALWLVSVLAVAMILGINARRIEDVGQAVEQSNKLSTLAKQESQRADDENAIARRLLYASRMRQAQQAWRDGNLTFLNEILRYYSDGTSEAGLRHFEWYHLNHRANLPHRVHRGHTGEVFAVAYAPDGRLIVSGGQDGTVRLWDAASGEMLANLHEHTSCVNTIDVSPDGETFATASCDKTIKLWSLSERKVLATLTGHTQEVDMCAFTDEGKQLVSLSRYTTGPREARLWDVATRSIRSDWPPADELIEGLTAGPAGKTIVTLAGKQAAVWKQDGDAWVLSHRCNNVNSNSDAVLSPDEEYLLVPGWPRYLRTFRVRDGVLFNELSDHTGGVLEIAFSPAGDRMATASGDGSIRVFEFPSFKPEQLFLGHVGKTWNVAWSPRGDSLASVGDDGTLRVWDLQQGSSKLHLKIPAERLPATTGVWDFAYLKDGQYVNAVYKGYNLTWNVKTGLSVSPEQVPGPRLRSTNHRPDAPYVEATHALLPQWDWRAYFMPIRHYLKSFDVPRETISCARIVGDGSRVIKIQGKRLQTWNIDPLELLADQDIEKHNLPLIHLDISRDGGRLCGASSDETVQIYDLNRWTIVELGKTADVKDACFSPNGDRILVRGNEVREYDAYTGTLIRTYSHERPIAISYSADSQRVAVATQLGYTAIHDAVTGEETLRLDAGAPAIVFASDGTSLLTSGPSDGGLFYWPGQK